MAYVAYFLKFKPTLVPAEKVVFSNFPAKSYVGKELNRPQFRSQRPKTRIVTNQSPR
ncbi:hypothetical protein DPMN_150454 [Dreissena polymorpha]|uniref:Uncharacterized protein n=1 Tax=Dreissena polymorpha TaxID=45954 RepID=A0A9D4FJC8_DREPO|nr:hypothetical protein DPMN_150454 [Dreissena polymorpha]